MVNKSFDVFFSIVFIYNFESDVWLNIINNAKMKLPVLERIADKCTDRSPFKHFPFLLPSQSYQYEFLGSFILLVSVRYSVEWIHFFTEVVKYLSDGGNFFFPLPIWTALKWQPDRCKYDYLRKA